MGRRHKFLTIRYLLVAVTGLSTTLSLAGGGPENVLLVVNPRSQTSLTIANHYIQLRNIPTQNVLYLPWVSRVTSADIDTFRREILVPILIFIARGHHVRRIDYVVYSSDFPWKIDARPDIARYKQRVKELKAASNPKNKDATDNKTLKSIWPKVLTAENSITGATYLYQSVMSGTPAYMQLNRNNYFRRPKKEKDGSTTLGFKSSLRFKDDGQLSATDGQSYLLSTMLAVTRGRGNTQKEALRYLRRSATVDGTHPRGTIYFAKSKDIRSKVRHNAFPQAADKLIKIGVKAKIVEGILPKNATDIQGLMTGSASLRLKNSKNRILPGAICENLTSHGGNLQKKAGQTPLSSFLRFGSAGSSGTVAEPYALQAKFPVPMIQVHYARGCSLAEAFYQSIHGPYQLLIVGDPLCRPWANIPEVSVDGIKPHATAKGKLFLKPSAKTSNDSTIDNFEFFVDAVQVSKSRPGKSITLDTTRLPDGYHVLRVVAIENTPIQSQGSLIVPFNTNNKNRSIKVVCSKTGTIIAGEQLTISVESPESKSIAVFQNTRMLDKITGDSGTLTIDTSTLGLGPVTLQIISLGELGTSYNVVAKPINLTVKSQQQ